jgi:Secretion system C-terminal sorting domain
MIRASQFCLFIFLFLAINFGKSPAQAFKYLGPDSLTWRHLLSADVKLQRGEQIQLSVVTTSGISVFYNNIWHYVLINQSSCSFPPMTCTWYRTVTFSPISDSVLLESYDFEYDGEGGSGVASCNYLLGFEYPQVNGVGGFTAPGLYSYMYGDSSAIYRSIFSSLDKSYDGGVTWVSLSETFHGFLSPRSRAPRLYTTNITHGFLQGVQVSSTSNDGLKWDSLYSIAGSFATARILTFGDTLFLFTNALPNPAHSLCGIFKSNNGGSSWTQTLSGRNIISITYGTTANSVYAATSDSIFRSVNAGIDWQGVFAVPFSSIIQILKHPSADTIFVATADSGLFSLAGTAVQVRRTINNVTGYMLEQNFPNPFNPSTLFRFAIPRTEHVSLQVFDVLGRQVSQVINERMNAGTYERQWSGNSLTSGIYFYRLTAGPYVASRKLVLLK